MHIALNRISSEKESTFHCYNGQAIAVLPSEMLDKILTYLSYTQRQIAACVCHAWNKQIESIYSVEGSRALKQLEIDNDAYRREMHKLIDFLIENIEEKHFDGPCSYGCVGNPYNLFIYNLDLIKTMLEDTPIDSLVSIAYGGGGRKIFILDRPIYNNKDSILVFLACEIEKLNEKRWEKLLKCPDAPNDLLNELRLKRIKLDELDKRIQNPHEDLIDIFAQYIANGFYWRVFYFLTFDTHTSNPNFPFLCLGIFEYLFAKDFQLVQLFCDMWEPDFRSLLLAVARTAAFSQKKKDVAFDFQVQFLNEVNQGHKNFRHVSLLGDVSALFHLKWEDMGYTMLQIAVQHTQQLWDKKNAISYYYEIADGHSADNPEASAEIRKCADELTISANTALGILKKTLSVAKHVFFWD